MWIVKSKADWYYFATANAVELQETYSVLSVIRCAIWLYKKDVSERVVLFLCLELIPSEWLQSKERNCALGENLY